MSLAQFIPSVWAARLLENLNKQLIYAQSSVINKDFEGEINAFGDKVHIHNIGPITVADYNRDTTTITPELLTDERRTLEITQSKYFAFQVDDLDRAQQRPKVMDAASRQASYNLAEVADRYIASHYSQAGHVQDDGAGAALQLTAQNAYLELVKASVTLDEANIPSEGRFAVVPPWVAGLLLSDDRFFLRNQVQPMLNAQIGRIANFNVMKSNNVPTTGTSTVVSHIMCGHSSAITMAEQISKVEGYRPHDSFSDALKGLHLYGARVVRPEALLDLQVKR